MHSLVFSSTLALILSFPAPQTSASKAKKDHYAVTFSVHYSYTDPLVQKNSKPLGKAYCGLTRCEGPLDIVINRATQRKGEGLFALGSYMCWPHRQTLTFCTQRGYDKTYGGCPYWQCTIDRSQSCRGVANKWCIYHQHHNGTTWLHIQDPNHDKWKAGVTGTLYHEAVHFKPTVFISVFRTVSKYNTTWDISVLTEDIKQQELSLKASLASTPLLTWPEIIQTTLDILNNTNWLKITSCFLCAAFQQSLLIATPVPLSATLSFNSSLTADDTTKNFHLAPPQGNLTCILLNTTVRSAPPFKCTHNLTSNATCAPPPLFYWCNGTVSCCINDSILVPCIPVLLTPHLTYYTQGELHSLLAPRQPRAILLLILIRMALVGAVTALGLSAGGLAHSVLQGQHFEALQQINLQSTAESLESLQRQLTSLAQVTLQNHRALDLLTAEKGGTCLFLQEECCYYINESGIVEQNVKILREFWAKGYCPPSQPPPCRPGSLPLS
ncbi:endogenous retrovirus group FC1 member 1 Env polyprotein-like [Dasypus novemcinctus]|uniref:endogenous retrovirus group FC1 member 1 Env polyprotein-like n=1 Tax=Dasypus novemcinctus TaxID=9361 RepID=UPI0039C91823